MPFRPPVFGASSRPRRERQRDHDRARAQDPGRQARKRIYNSAAWRTARRRKLAEQPLCEDCLVHDRLTEATEVDHVVALQDGGDPFDPANLRSLCHPCHSSKTARERAARGRAGQILGA